MKERVTVRDADRARIEQEAGKGRGRGRRREGEGEGEGERGRKIGKDTSRDISPVQNNQLAHELFEFSVNY